LKTILCILKGILTYVPGLYRAASGSTGGTDSARYCYSVWLRHLVLAGRNGLSHHPAVVAELGPGDSLGIGLAALLSGSSTYYALDVVEFASLERNLVILNELVELFRTRAPVPDEQEFPHLRPLLDNYDFPGDLLPDAQIVAAMRPERVEAIRAALVSPNTDAGQTEGVLIRYQVPWNDSGIIEPNSVDLLFSQAVFEHVEEVERTHHEACAWVRPGGFLSHEIDFSCHLGLAQWNKQWTYGDFMWTLIKGRRSFLINREPCSTHLESLRHCGVEMVCEERSVDSSGIDRSDLAPCFKSVSDEDFVTKSVLIQAIKKS